MTGFPSSSRPRPAYLLREGGARFRRWTPAGRRRRMWRWVTANIRVPARCRTHASRRAAVIFKACRLQHVIRPRPKEREKKRQTSYIPEPIPQSTITSLNSSTLDGGARAHPVVLAPLPARAAQSVFLVAMATRKHCTHAYYAQRQGKRSDDNGMNSKEILQAIIWASVANDL